MDQHTLFKLAFLVLWPLFAIFGPMWLFRNGRVRDRGQRVATILLTLTFLGIWGFILDVLSQADRGQQTYGAHSLHCTAILKRATASDSIHLLTSDSLCQRAFFDRRYLPPHYASYREWTE